LGLSIGLAAAMLIMLYVKDEVSYDRFHKNFSQIYRVDRQIARADGSVDNSGYSGYFQGPRFTANIPEIKSFVRFWQTSADAKKGTDIQTENVCMADSNFFSDLSFPLISGNPKTVLIEPNSIVITEDMAKKYFGNSDAVGKTILFRDGNGFAPSLVTGVAKNCPQNSSIKFQAIMPMKVSAKDQSATDNWFNFFLNTFVVLNPNANVKTTEAKMQKVFLTDASEAIKMIQEKYKITNLGLSYYLQPLADIHLSKKSEGLSESNPVYSYILSAIALFILLIACINFVNLTVARSVKRAKEIGIRKVIGGNRKQLMFQFLGESFVLCLIAFVAAIFLTQLILPVFNQLSDKALSLSYLLDSTLIMSYISLFILTSLLAGFYPALVLSNYNPVQTLYSRFTLAGKNYLQKSLVVLQFALASFLIIGTFAIFSQFNYLTTQKLGYDDSNLIMVDRFSTTKNEAQLFKKELMKNPNIIDVASKNNDYSGNTVKVNAAQNINITVETVDPSYLPMLKIPVVQGRNFSDNFPADATTSVLVNESFVKEAGWQNPIGETITTFDNADKLIVVGVVKDYHFKPLTQKIEPQFFTMNPNNEFGTFYIKIKPHSETASLAYIQKTFQQQFPLTAYSYSFKADENIKSYESEARWKQILLFGAVLTIFISSIGLFGLTVLSAEKRTKEIGIRKVLGASVGSVVSILSKDFLKLVMIALLISMPVAWMAINKWLQNYPYRITLSWMMFASAALFVVLIALATISFQAIKAAVANPVKSLGTE
jgi:putative ABC transport system permease protein